MGANAPQQRHNTFVIRSEVSGRFPSLPHLGTRRHGVTPPNAGHCPTLPHLGTRHHGVTPPNAGHCPSRPHLGTRQIRWGRSTESRGVCFLRGHARALAPAQDCPHPPARAGRAWRTARPAGARPTTGAPAPAARTAAGQPSAFSQYSIRVRTPAPRRGNPAHTHLQEHHRARTHTFPPTGTCAHGRTGAHPRPSTSTRSAC